MTGAALDEFLGGLFGGVTLVVELGGRPMAVKTEVLKDAGADGAGDEQREQMKARALAENAVQGLLDVFPGEILDVQEGK